MPQMSCECAHVFVGYICSCNIVPVSWLTLLGFYAHSRMQPCRTATASCSPKTAYSSCCQQPCVIWAQPSQLARCTTWLYFCPRPAVAQRRSHLSLAVAWAFFQCGHCKVASGSSSNSSSTASSFPSCHRRSTNLNLLQVAIAAAAILL
jgi:hypothetical protein